MKAHIGVDAESGLVHTVRGTFGHVSDIAEANSLLHGEETLAFGDAGYQGIEKRPDAKADVAWHIAMRPGKRRALNKSYAADALIDQAEKLKVGMRCKLMPRLPISQHKISLFEINDLPFDATGSYSEHLASLKHTRKVDPRTPF